VTIVKRLIGRVRPSDLGPFSYVPWSWKPQYASLPSGHGTTAVAAAIAIGALWPKARVPMWTFAVVIALSRVVIQAHFASDVIAAAFCGAFGAILVRNWFAARRLGFTVGADGTVRPLPGPSWRRIRTVAARLIRQ
jgi:membrane-associated phospholipid phosphatase